MKKLLLPFLLFSPLFGGATGNYRHTRIKISWIDIEKQKPSVGDKIIISDGNNITVVTYEKNALLWKLNLVKRWMLAKNVEGASSEVMGKTGEVC